MLAPVFLSTVVAIKLPVDIPGSSMSFLQRPLISISRSYPPKPGNGSMFNFSTFDAIAEALVLAAHCMAFHIIQN
jgi:hypothetical protein